MTLTGQPCCARRGIIVTMVNARWSRGVSNAPPARGISILQPRRRFYQGAMCQKNGCRSHARRATQMIRDIPPKKSSRSKKTTGRSAEASSVSKVQTSTIFLTPCSMPTTTHVSHQPARFRDIVCNPHTETMPRIHTKLQVQQPSFPQLGHWLNQQHHGLAALFAGPRSPAPAPQHLRL